MSHTISTIRARNPMWVYERNYRLLMGLFPTLWSGEQSTGSLSYSSQSGEMQIRVVERCRYTLSAVMTEAYRDRLVPEIRMQVRLYIDANVAEVLAYQGASRLLPGVLDLGNSTFTPLEEKRHINLLLHDWLVAIQKEQNQSLAETDCPAQ
ncbi:MAG: DUF1249 domain-containing protein [Gammaproteobacteria bacterium]|nr:DUF1249 domain-containing protein [Gammaproteobacteria bacterium]MDH5652922.1 DUF1249 domain-containing protein [Gammaproteobacteria bacterium]